MTNQRLQVQFLRSENVWSDHCLLCWLPTISWWDFLITNWVFDNFLSYKYIEFCLYLLSNWAPNCKGESVWQSCVNRIRQVSVFLIFLLPTWSWEIVLVFFCHRGKRIISLPSVPIITVLARHGTNCVWTWKSHSGQMDITCMTCMNCLLLFSPLSLQPLISITSQTNLLHF